MSRLLSALVRIMSLPLSPRRHPFCRADAIVVLGATLRPNGRPSHALQERMRAGVELYHRGGAPVLCVTGGGPEGRVEADTMARLALEQGIPAAALRVERRARSTSDNARFTAELLRAEGCHAVWVVSQPYHLRRASWLFRRAGLAPLGWHADHSIQYRWPRLAMRWLLREYVACAYVPVRIIGCRLRRRWRARGS